MDEATPMTDAQLRERLTRLQQKQRRQASRIAELEQEVAETRRLHRRVAEIADVVAELLVPAVDRDDERLRAALAELGRPETSV
jgi:uncharacterized coiled-coil protein SlyX